MKRSKIMLTAIGVLAIVGGALAFKANTFGGGQFCYTTTTASAALCPLKAVNAAPIAGQAIKYTTTTNTLLCPQLPATRCTKVGGGFIQ